jgi:Flp pilus assembly protein TadB
MVGPNRGQGPQRPIKGFRPGKEPPELRQRLAKNQFRDLSPTQQRLVELFAGRSPAESKALVRRWLLGLVAAGVILGVAALALSAWSLVAGIIVAILAAGALFLAWRLQLQREALGAMADAVGQRGPAKGKRTGG